MYKFYFFHKLNSQRYFFFEQKLFIDFQTFQTYLGNLQNKLPQARSQTFIWGRIKSAA